MKVIDYRQGRTEDMDALPPSSKKKRHKDKKTRMQKKERCDQDADATMESMFHESTSDDFFELALPEDLMDKAVFVTDMNQENTAPCDESETEQGLVQDISAMIQAMSQKTSQRADRYQRKADKTLEVAVENFLQERQQEGGNTTTAATTTKTTSHTMQSNSKALVYMRKYSYYRVRVQHMQGVHGQLNRLLDSLVVTNDAGTTTTSPVYHISQVPATLARLQDMLRKIPLSSDTDHQLWQELMTAVDQNDVRTLRRDNLGGNASSSSPVTTR